MPTVKNNKQGPVRIVHLAHAFVMGGLEKLLVELGHRVDRDRFELMFVSLSDRNVLSDDIEATNWPVVTLAQPEGLRPGSVFRLAALMRKWKPGIVHTHDPKSLIYGAPAARLARVPRVIHTCHGNVLAPYSRGARLFQMAFWFADMMVCVSDGTVQQMVEIGINPRKIQMILNGIDTESFSFSGPQLGGNAVTVSRLSPEKDVDNLLRAVAIIRETCPSFRVDIAGDGPCMADLQATVRELGIASQVRFLGLVRDVPSLLKRSSLFILPSLTEGVSLTLLEAMACGLPIVATRVGGTPEVVVEGETGLLVSPGSPEELAQAILCMHQNPERGRQMGGMARQRIETHFDIRRMVSDYEEMYRVLQK